MVSGPSGVGKSTVVDLVLERTGGIERSVSVTTRARRGSERDGVEYSFVSMEEFERMRGEGMLLEWALVHGNYYGTSAAQVDGMLAAGSSVLLEIDVQGGMEIKGKRPDALLIFIMPPSMEELERRLRGRKTDGEETIMRRLENARREMESSGQYDHLLVNDDLESCAERARELIVAAMEG